MESASFKRKRAEDNDSDEELATSSSPLSETSKWKERDLRQNRKRSFRFSPSSSCDSEIEFHIPQNVSRWTLFHAERLHIYYSKYYTKTPKDLFSLLDKTIHPFNDQQKQYIERIKSLLQFDCKKRGPFLRESVYRAAYDSLNEALGGIKKELCSVYKSGNSLDALVSHRVFVFVRELLGLLNVFKDTKRLLKDVPKTCYVPVCASFIQMCNLTVQSCKVSSQWEHLGDQKIVSSIPDLRFFQNGKNFDEFIFTTTQIVVEVTKDVRQKREEPSVGCLDGEGEDSNKPEIMKDLSESVLGQHAGELLLEIRHNYVEKQENGIGKYMVPGMIVEGTKVYFTLLEMTTDHIDELATNKDYKKMANATIHYVKPLDLIFKEERDILVDSFVMLNNIEFSSERFV